MKKIVCLALALMCLLMAGCNFNTNFSNSGLGGAKMEATPQVGEMLNVLAGKDMDAALALMHPSVLEPEEEREEVKAMLQQMMDFIDGRQFQSLAQVSLSVNSSTGTAGSVKQESASFRFMLGDTVYHLTVVSLTQGGNTGFVSYQLVLGVV